MSYRFDSPGDSAVAVEVCDTADDFLQELSNYGEMSEHIVDSGSRAIRDAERSLASMLTRLSGQGLCAFGAQRPMLLTVGKEPPTAWRESVVVVRIAEEVEGVDPLVAVVAEEIPQG